MVSVQSSPAQVKAAPKGRSQFPAGEEKSTCSGAAPMSWPSPMPSTGRKASTAAVARAPARAARVRSRNRLRPSRSNRVAESNSASARPCRSATRQASAIRDNSCGTAVSARRNPSAPDPPSRLRAALTANARATAPSVSCAATSAAALGCAPIRNSPITVSNPSNNCALSPTRTRSLRTRRHRTPAVPATSTEATKGPTPTTNNAGNANAPPTRITLPDHGFRTCSEERNTRANRRRPAGTGRTSSATATHPTTTPECPTGKTAESTLTTRYR